MSSTYFDPSKREAEKLNKVLEGGASVSDDFVVLDENIAKREQEKEALLAQEGVTNVVDMESVIPTLSVKEARKEAPILEGVSGRIGARLLLVTKDVSYMQEGTAAFRRLVDQGDRFLEIHVIILNEIDTENESFTTRLRENVWVYPTNSHSWWMLCFDAYKTAQEQLVFSGGFRADIIVAEDAFESGMVALYLSNKYARPFQVHITEDFFDNAFVATQKHPALYEWCVGHVLDEVTSVRTKTEFQRRAVIAERKDLESMIEILPNYYSLDAWEGFAPTLDLHQKYPQFKFIILHVSSMQTSSHTKEVIAGSAKMLRRYPTIGLIILGNGPQRAAFEKEVIALGLQKQVEFEPMPTEVISYLKTANVCIHLSEVGAEDELILMAAIAKVPLIANIQGIAGKLFVDGESACLCKADDVECVANSVNRYLNENHDRTHFALSAHEIVLERVEQDYGAYLDAYAASIERCVTLKS